MDEPEVETVFGEFGPAEQAPDDELRHGCIRARRRTASQASPVTRCVPLRRSYTRFAQRSRPGRRRRNRMKAQEIGRASCRERVCKVRVDLGGRRIIKKKKNTKN